MTGGISEKIYLRDGCTSERGDDKQPGVNAAAELSSGAMFARLASLVKVGTLAMNGQLTAHLP